MVFPIQIIFQLFLAAFLGALVGFERELKKRQAGLQTYSLVTLGACLFTILSLELLDLSFGKNGVSFDPSRIIQSIAVGIGFLGAGVIFHRKSHIEGLTTAAGLWTTAAIGIAIGTRLYLLAVIATLLIIGILVGLGIIEERFFKE